MDTGVVDMDEDFPPLVDKGKQISASGSGAKLSEKNFATGSLHGAGSSSGISHAEDEYDGQYVLLQSYFDDLDTPTGVEVDVPTSLLNALDIPTSNSSTQFPLGEALGGGGAADDLSCGYDNQYAVLQSYFDDLDIPSGVDFEIPFLNSSSNLWPLEKENTKQKLASGSNMDYYEKYAILQSYFDDLDIPPGVEVTIPSLNSTMPSQLTHNSSGTRELSHTPLGSDKYMVGSSSQKQILNDHEITKHASKDKNDDEILKELDRFKRFDTVQDYSDHYYASVGSSMKQPSKGWAKKIQEEWRLLGNDLPEAIYVRVYESRMDLLRAVIIGAEGTPYQDGLFFFDVLFPDNYPSVPPMVYYRSHGLRINPNLYGNGKVCLSLLNTWTGGMQEMWNPHLSTILQVLVSIQGLILNAKPYFNEPGFEAFSGHPSGETSSSRYNEETFISSLKTMVYTIRKPPKHFEDFVAEHFRQHGRDILAACKAYSNGAQVGNLIKGGSPNLDQGNNSSKKFKDSLAGYVKTVVDAFAQVDPSIVRDFSF